MQSCNSATDPVFSSEHANFASNGDHPKRLDRRSCSASVAVLLGLVGLPWLRSSPERREKFEIEKTMRMARALTRRNAHCARRHRAPGSEPAAQGSSKSSSPAPARPPLFSFETKFESEPAAELLSAARERVFSARPKTGPWQCLRTEIHCRRCGASRVTLDYGTEADRPALLHGRLCAGVPSGRAVGDLICPRLSPRQNLPARHISPSF